MKLSIIPVLTLLALSTGGFCQSSIQRKVNDVERRGVAFANVLLKNKSDSVLTYTQKFGNNKVKGSRNRSTGSQEEQNRVTN